MSLEELRKIIQKSEFKNLLYKYDFKEVYKRRKINDGYHDRYLIGFESNICKMGFYYEPGGGISILLGTLSDNFDDWESAGWVGMDYVISFLLKQPIKKWHNYTNKSRNDQILDSLSATAKNFEPLSDQIIRMFQNQNTVAEWKQALESYIKEDTRRRYGEG